MPPGRAALSLSLFLCACTESGGSSTGTLIEPALVVDPAQFVGDVRCVPAPGGLRRYVATLLDVTSPPLGAPQTEGFVLPSSSPTSCDLAVHFHRIAPLHRYVADIDGYDRDDLTPVAPGSPILVDGTGNVVRPRWRTSCGRGASVDAGVDASTDSGRDSGPPMEAGVRPDATVSVDAAVTDGAVADANDASADDAVAPVDADAPDGSVFPDATVAAFSLARRRVLMRGCLPLQERGTEPVLTGIRVDLAPALGALACGEGSGEITRYEVTLDGGTTLAGACSEPLTFVGLNAGDGYSFRVEAFEGESATPSFVTECFQVAATGLVLPALCDPLRPAG